MADTLARLNHAPLYVPSLGRAFRPGGWDYEANAPTGAKGTEYGPGEWETELAATAEPAAEVEGDDKPRRARRSSKATKSSKVAEAESSESTDEAAAGPSDPEE